VATTVPVPTVVALRARTSAGAKATLIGMKVGAAERPRGWRPSSRAGISTSSSGSLAMLVAMRRGFAAGESILLRELIPNEPHPANR
jgi:hypothetical protein